MNEPNELKAQGTNRNCIASDYVPRSAPAVDDSPSVWNQTVSLDTWPLTNVLAELAGWAQHFMTVHDCDCHGYEELSFLIPAARQHAAEIRSLKRTTKENGNAAVS